MICGLDFTSGSFTLTWSSTWSVSSTLGFPPFPPNVAKTQTKHCKHITEKQSNWGSTAVENRSLIHCLRWVWQSPWAPNFRSNQILSRLLSEEENIFAAWLVGIVDERSLRCFKCILKPGSDLHKPPLSLSVPPKLLFSVYWDPLLGLPTCSPLLYIEITFL